MITSFSLDEAMTSRAEALFIENHRLGEEIRVLTKDKASREVELKQAKAEAEKWERKCRLLETENERLQKYINR